MKVIDILDNDFTQACYLLANNVMDNFCPDAIIGVLTGGGVVGRTMLHQFENKKCIPKYFEYKIQRDLTKKKEYSGARTLLTKFPRFITNILILIEVLILEYRSKLITPKRFIKEELANEIRKDFSNSDIRSLLIVDDCIDTGKTLEVLVDFIKEINPNLIIKVAVITITHNYPTVFPDYTLYNRTICRFPWSMEIKK